MKHSNFSMVGAAALVAMLAVPVFAQDAASSTSDDTPRVFVNQSQVNFEGQTPIEQQGHLLVPLRGILEKMGAYVDFDSSSQTVTAFEGQTRISLPIGSREATVNGQSVPLDTPAQVINGSTMVPLRFVAESLGANVAYDVNANTVRIHSNAVGNSADSELPPGPDPQRWHDHRGQGDHPGDFHGQFAGIIRQGDNNVLFRTSEGRQIWVAKSSPVFWQGQRINITDLRPGDRLSIAVDPNTHTGTRIMVDRQ